MTILRCSAERCGTGANFKGGGMAEIDKAQVAGKELEPNMQPVK